MTVIQFKSTFEYKLIYVMRINDNEHSGLLKIGDATVKTDKSGNELVPNCKELNSSAKERIKSYTQTASISYDLLHTELAIRTVTKKGRSTIKAFRDNAVHDVLIRSGIPRHVFDMESQGKEWFKTDLETAKKAIRAVKDGQNSLKPGDISEDDSPIVFRPEQAKAIKDTITQFKKGDRMLWNAKMRFGKTLTALQVAKEMGFRKTLIFTHRPVVSDGWYEDFVKIFKHTDYVFGSKTKGETIDNLADTDKPFVYFVSMQDLRGSSAVGGKFDKNEYVFLIDWDFVVVDEAHEGTQTTLGQKVFQAVLDNTDKKPKMLELSGTPFNLLSDFKENEIYTWDYIMEQRAKRDWPLKHFGDSNPYEELPQLEMFTYNLDKALPGYIDVADGAFNFRELFRTWTGDIGTDFKPVPTGVKVGDFVNENSVWAFLNLLTKSDGHNNYPFSTEENRSYYRHTLWMVPGVKEAKALSKLLQSHPVFGSGAFKVVNVAGEGDEEQDYKNALKAVRNAIGNDPDDHYTITISCGRLTTGVTVPEWTAVLMLYGTFSTSASNYLQTIFRVQSPANINGRIKERCSVFDFAPDRTLKMVAEAVSFSTKAGDTSGDKRILGEFLNFCPVIAIDGSEMKPYNVDGLLQQLKRAYTDNVVKNGFDDRHVYNDNLLKLDDVELQAFENLKNIIGSGGKKGKSKQQDTPVNEQGFTNEEYAEVEKGEKKQKKERTPEEQAKFEELKKQKNNAQKAMRILRGISIRIPLLIYGADVPVDKEITADNFVDLMNDSSWNEFMPDGVTPDVYRNFAKYYEQDVFVAAGKQIRYRALSADALSPLERTKRIAELFTTFKNPDKETVLTPWRVVNMHMSECLGGWCFYNEDFTETLEEPRFVDRGDITKDTFSNVGAKILEINSKTGLYPLYVTYSIFRERLDSIPVSERTLEKQYELWDKTVEENIFVICKTPMAKSITKRTLLGYRQGKINAHAFDDLINQLKEKPQQFKEKVLRGSTWNKKESVMKFNAVVGNPPYQISDGGAQASSTPVYNLFVEGSKKLDADFISLIMPSRWMTGGKGLDDFRQKMISDEHIIKLFDHYNAADCFENVEIKGGICYFLRDKKSTSPCEVVSYTRDGVYNSTRYLSEPGENIFIRENRLISIKCKVQTLSKTSFDQIVSSMKPFGLRGDVFKNPKKYELPEMSTCVIENGLTIYGLDEHQKRTKRYVAYNYPIPKKDFLLGYKLFMSRNQGSGILGEEFSTPIFAKPNECCTETFVVIGLFNTHNESLTCWKYIKTKFFRALVGIKKQDQGASRSVYRYVPLQDFTDKSDIDWSKSVAEIDQQLYKKYNLSQEEIDFIEKTIKPMQ